ncbi:MAG TPA: hypothetical protein VJ694_02135 [Patescibacteria group bacterium]|nr:hypothetical protein [Patescibacteria group bacterium]
MPDIAHLISTRQYWVATWKVIDATSTFERKPLERVDEIVLKAVSDSALGDLRKIMRDFSAYVGEDASAAAYTALNETTEIDLQPDEL